MICRFHNLVLLVAAVAALEASAASLTLAKVCEKLALTATGCDTNTVVMSDGTNSLSLKLGYRRTDINGTAVWLNAPAEADFRETAKLDRSDVDKVLSPIIRGEPTRSTNEVFRVFLDPGHGGEDSGAISRINGQLEKDLVLDVAERVGAWLEDAGLQVFYSRTNDVFVTLDDRPILAKKAKADVFVSIHANMAGASKARGAETFALTLAGMDSTATDSRLDKSSRPGNAYDNDSAILGYAIHSRLPGPRGEADRGFRRARFQVLRQAACPAVLVELGFLSSKAETHSLASGRFREKAAFAIAEGIIDYAERARKE